MRYLLELSKEDIAFSSEEVKSLIKNKHSFLIGNFLLIDSNDKEIEFLSNRLGFTRRIFKVLFLCMEKNLEKYIKKFNFDNIYDGNFLLRLKYKSKMSEKEMASLIWRRLKKPKVKLRNAKTQFFVFKLKDGIFFTLLEREIYHDYLSRKAHKRPKLHPTSLHPKLARALINLTGIKKGTLVDPMCGSGGVLIEAGLMNLKPVGYDIDNEMIERAKVNLDYYKVKNYSLVSKDFNNVNKKINFIVCDLPYGLNTRQKDLSKLYDSFLSQLRKNLGKRAVVVFPGNYEKLIKKNKFKIINKFSVYIHKSLTRRIFILE